MIGFKRTTMEGVSMTFYESEDFFDEFDEQWLDITERKTEKILDLEDLDFDTSEFEQNVWVKKLGIDRPVMNNPQVRWEILNFYIKLCESANQLLLEKRQSLAGKVSRSTDAFLSSDRIYYAFYQVASMHVSRHYAQEKSPSVSGHWYLALQRVLGVRLVNEMYQLMLPEESKISAPNSKTRTAFFLTEYGTKSVYWDPEGILREKRAFNEQELLILNRTPERTVGLWEVEEVKAEIISLYLQLWQEIESILPEKSVWSKRNREKVLQFLDGTDTYLSWQEGNVFALDLLKLAENTVRKVLPKSTETAQIRIEIAQKNVENFFPIDLIYTFRGCLANYEKRLSEEQMDTMLEGLFYYGMSSKKLLPFALEKKKTPKGWVKLIQQYQDDGEYSNAITSAIKETKQDDLALLLTYELLRLDKGRSIRKQKINAILPKNNISKLTKLAEKKEKMSEKLAETILLLKEENHHQTIQLDTSKIAQSRQDLDQTVTLIDDYIEVENEPEEIAEEKKEEHSSSGVQLIVKLLEKGSLSLTEVKQVASEQGKLVNVYLSDINKEFYEFVNDQLILVEENQVKIDPFYIEIAKEIISSENSGKS